MLLLTSDRVKEIFDNTPGDKSAAAKRLWLHLRQTFERRLRSGELVATGYVSSMAIVDSPAILLADKWSVLEMDYKKASARAAGLVIVGIQVFLAALFLQVLPTGNGPDRPKGNRGRKSTYDESAFMKDVKRTAREEAPPDTQVIT